MALPLLLTALLVSAPTHPKIRVGCNYDGGYVMINLTGVVTYDHFLSGGVGHDNSFEIACLDLQPGIKGDVYDHTIPRLPQPDSRLTWHRTPVGPGGDSLTSYLDQYSNVLLKMDIEGGEFPWLAQVSDKQLKSIAQLVIEWHLVRTWTQKEWDIVTRVSKTHTLVHVHVCNCCGFDLVQGVQVPHVFECTYVRKDLEPSTTLSSAPIPGPLDMRNVLANPESSITVKNFNDFVEVRVLPFECHLLLLFIIIVVVWCIVAGINIIGYCRCFRR